MFFILFSTKAPIHCLIFCLKPKEKKNSTEHRNNAMQLYTIWGCRRKVAVVSLTSWTRPLHSTISEVAAVSDPHSSCLEEVCRSISVAPQQSRLPSMRLLLPAALPSPPAANNPLPRSLRRLPSPWCRRRLLSPP